MRQLGGLNQPQLYVGVCVQQSRSVDEREGMTHDVICQGFGRRNFIFHIPLPSPTGQQ